MKAFSLPCQTASAASNMAIDMGMLMHFPDSDAVRWRWYGWDGNAFTFGYRQVWEEVSRMVSNSIPAGNTFSLIRRASGGGLVDHRNDLTFAIVIPPNHNLFGEPPLNAYQCVHRALSVALNAQGAQTVLQACGKGCQTEGEQAPRFQSAQCFVQAEPGDIIAASTGVKVAGSAMKRTRQGLLIQCSISRKHLPAEFDAAVFRDEATLSLLGSLSVNVANFHNYPALCAPPVLLKQFASIEWNQYRKLPADDLPVLMSSANLTEP